MFAHATEAAKRADKKISSRTVGTDVIVLVIHVVNSCECMNCVCWQKSLAIVGMKSN